MARTLRLSTGHHSLLQSAGPDKAELRDSLRQLAVLMLALHKGLGRPIFPRHRQNSLDLVCPSV